RLDIPDTLETEIMNRHDRLDAPEERIGRKLCLQIYRDQTGLPVMTVNNIRFKIYNRKNRQNCLTEENVFLYVCSGICVRLLSAKIIQIVNKIIGDAVILMLHDTYMCMRNRRACTHI